MELAEDVPVEVVAASEVVGPALSFEGFFADHHSRLYSALCATTGSRQEAEELMQEAFLLRVWERWDRVSSLENPAGYLYRTAMNLFPQAPPPGEDRDAEGRRAARAGGRLRRRRRPRDRDPGAA